MNVRPALQVDAKGESTKPGLFEATLCIKVVNQTAPQHAEKPDPFGTALKARSRSGLTTSSRDPHFNGPGSCWTAAEGTGPTSDGTPGFRSHDWDLISLYRARWAYRPVYVREPDTQGTL